MTADLTNGAPGPGVYFGIPADVYHAWPYVSASKLKRMAVSAAKAYHHEKYPDSGDTDAKRFGRAAHTAVLEPEVFHRLYVIAPEGNKQKKVVKEAWAEAEKLAKAKGTLLLPRTDYDLCVRLRGRCERDELAGPMLTGRGKNEVSVVWEDDATGLTCKARIDRLCAWKGFTCHVDLKTTKDASPIGYPWECKRYKYHWSAAFYLHGCDVLKPGRRRFLHIAVEKVQPYDLGVYEIDEGDHQLSLDAGWNACREQLSRWKECVDSGIWPSHGGPHPLEL